MLLIMVTKPYLDWNILLNLQRGFQKPLNLGAQGDLPLCYVNMFM